MDNMKANLTAPELLSALAAAVCPAFTVEAVGGESEAETADDIMGRRTVTRRVRFRLTRRTPATGNGRLMASRELEAAADALTAFALPSMPPLAGGRRARRLERGEPAWVGTEPDGTGKLSLPLTLVVIEEKNL